MDGPNAAPRIFKDLFAIWLFLISILWDISFKLKEEISIFQTLLFHQLMFQIPASLLRHLSLLISSLK